MLAATWSVYHHLTTSVISSLLLPLLLLLQVRLHTDKDTRKSKGYAHVHFADDAGLEQ